MQESNYDFYKGKGYILYLRWVSDKERGHTLVQEGLTYLGTVRTSSPGSVQILERKSK